MVSAVAGRPPTRTARANARHARNAAVGGQGVPRGRRSGERGGRGRGRSSEGEPRPGGPVPWYMMDAPPAVVDQLEPAVDALDSALRRLVEDRGDAVAWWRF
eukprot:3340392-Pyramimonas_sp.AAC.1